MKRLMEHLLLVVTIKAICVINGMARTIRVPGNYPTIQQAVDAAVDGDLVSVSSGTYNEKVLISSKTITLVSTDGPAATTISNYNDDVVIISGSNNASCISEFTITANNTQGSGVICGRLNDNAALPGIPHSPSLPGPSTSYPLLR